MVNWGLIVANANNTPARPSRPATTDARQVAIRRATNKANCPSLTPNATEKLLNEYSNSKPATGGETRQLANCRNAITLPTAQRTSNQKATLFTAEKAKVVVGAKTNAT
jgi:hypothetical protein